MQRYHAAEKCSWPVADGEYVLQSEAQSEIARLRLEKDHALLTADAAIEEVRRLQEEVERLTGENHALIERVDWAREQRDTAHNDAIESAAIELEG